MYDILLRGVSVFIHYRIHKINLFQCPNFHDKKKKVTFSLNLLGFVKMVGGCQQLPSQFVPACLLPQSAEP